MASELEKLKIIRQHFSNKHWSRNLKTKKKQNINAMEENNSGSDCHETDVVSNMSSWSNDGL